MLSFTEFQANLATVRARIDAACQRAQRSRGSVQLLPVTKNHPVDAAQYAADAGLSSVGENRVQEAQGKRATAPAELQWELIGHLQSNKVKDAVATFDRIQSVDSLKVLQRIDRLSGEIGKCMPILLQCNTGEDPNKYGFTVAAIEAALEAALGASNLEVQGLMTIAPLDDDPDVAKATFERLRELRDQLATRFAVDLAELSMGMTGDLEIAIGAGSTQIRVGTALYGARVY